MEQPMRNKTTSRGAGELTLLGVARRGADGSGGDGFQVDFVKRGFAGGSE